MLILSSFVPKVMAGWTASPAMRATLLRTSQKKPALVLLIRTRRTPEVLDQTCGSCHPEITSRHVTSIHSAFSGIQLSLHDFIGEQEGEQRYQATCRKCHTTCSNCHMEQPGAHGVLFPRTESHKFEADPPTENCVACHEGTGMTFVGDGTKEGRIPSVMATAGMQCMSCHTEQDVHGTGLRTNFLVEISQA